MPMTNEQLNAAAAKCLGWEKKKHAGHNYWVYANRVFVIREHKYTPASNLEQAWGFARAKGNKFEMSAWRVFVSGGYTEECDGTPQGAARALTTCVLRANGVEV